MTGALGLKDTGYVERENVAIEYRWADNQIDRLPSLATELVRRQVAVIAALNTYSGLAAKAATTTIPIVFIVGEDPVRLGLVASLARPGGNVTGVNPFSGELTAKRLELLREMVPQAARIAVLVNPAHAVNHGDDVERRAIGCPRHGIANPGPQRQYQPRDRCGVRHFFARAARRGLRRVFFNGRRAQLVNLAAYHRVPATFVNRDFAEIGGLMSYGSNIADSWRQVGVYTGRILKGAKPADLPVVQATKFELVINAQTARMLGLTVPDKLLATADEVIE
jgi:putative ABC transport system substrate-binding protein